MKITTTLILLLTASTIFAERKSVHVFILSGQSNMAKMNPEGGFVPEARKLFGSEEVVYFKVAKGGQPICRWVKEWPEIAKKNGLDSSHIDRILQGESTKYYQPILDKYKALLENYPNPASVTFCWMQGERDAKEQAGAAYAEALKRLISNLRRDLKQPDMNFVIGRIGDVQLEKREHWNIVRKAQFDVVNADPRGAWIDVDDLNNKEKDGNISNDVHFTKEGYEVLGRRFARQGKALVTGQEPAANGKPTGAESE